MSTELTFQIFWNKFLAQKAFIGKQDFTEFYTISFTTPKSKSMLSAIAFILFSWSIFENNEKKF